MDSNAMKGYGLLVLGLFVVAIIFGLTYIGLGYLKETACEQGDSGYYWSGSQCQVSSTNTTAVTVDAVTAISTVQTGVGIALGLLSLVIIVAVFGAIIKITRKFSGKSM